MSSREPRGESLYLFESLKEVTSQYLDDEQIDLLKQAYIVARNAHEGQFRSSGEPYITHPLAVSHLLADMRMDYETVAAALLHDVIEDTDVSHDMLAEQFGTNIADLVEGVSKLDKLKFRDKKEAQAENFRKMMMAMVQDIRVILIKLTDRTHNMRTLGALRPDKRRRIARETLEIYTPIANRLGIHAIKNELEELGFEALYPMRYRVLKEAVKNARGNRKELIKNILDEIAGRLEDAGIQGSVMGREKHLFSIYTKMTNKELQFHEVMDIYGFRIIVDNLDTCYRVLGQMHSLYKPRPGRFKDYIAIPKANGYQSLHTTLVGPHGVPVEIQIRTHHMDHMADKGIAAHWSYKNNEPAGSAAQVRAQRWMQSLLELQQSAGNSFEFIENVKTDLFPEEIYVFTPEGKIIEMTTGATPVDFAYAVHTDIGNSCVGARVNRQPYPLSRPLANGQTVEIITAPGARPNAAWLNFVLTGKARSRIRQFLKTQEHQDSVALGKRLLNHALGDSSLEDIPNETITRVLNESKNADLDEMLSNIGLGNAMSLVIARRLLGDEETLHHAHRRSSMAIRGADGVMVTYAKCCQPIPGDPIVGHISPGKGLVVHLESCRNIYGYQKEPDHYISLRWSDDADQLGEYRSELRIDVVNHQGILANLMNVVASTGANIHNIVTDEKAGRVYTIDLQITTKSRIHLAGIMRKIKVIPDVLRIVRNRG